MFCPKGCKAKYGGKQWMSLKLDERGLPKSYKCPVCNFEQPCTLKEKLAEIIYGADWFFGVPEHCEVDEYCMENEEKVINDIIAVIKTAMNGDVE